MAVSCAVPDGCGFFLQAAAGVFWANSAELCSPEMGQRARLSTRSAISAASAARTLVGVLHDSTTARRRGCTAERARIAGAGLLALTLPTAADED